ncbi:MAG: MFS transporter, partial [Ilumatobacteraceae bacterium]
ISGSVFVSLYSPRITEAFGAIPGLVDALPDGVFDQAQDSVGAAFAVAERSPAAVRPQVVNAVSESFMSGFGTACLVVSAAAFVGSILALRFLPARSASHAAS